MSSDLSTAHQISNEQLAEALVIPEPIGTLFEVASNTITISIAPSLKQPILVGELVCVQAHATLAIGEVVSLVTIPTGIQICATLFSSIDSATLAISGGVVSLPSSGSTVYRPMHFVAQAILEGRATLFDDLSKDVTLKLCTSPLCPEHPLSFTPEQVLGRHCAIVGSSGSGKSWSVARLVEECALHSAKVVLVDPTGEYETLSGPVRHLNLGGRPLESNSQGVLLPYYELTETDLIAILRPTNGTQIAKLRAAIRSLKLLQFAPQLGLDGALPKAHRSKLPYEQAFDDFQSEIAAPENRFNIARLALQIGFECVDPIRSQTETSTWGGMNVTDYAACVPLITTIEDLLQGDALDIILKPHHGASLIEELNTFLADPKFSVLRVSCQELPTLHRAREIAANALARHLLRLARAGTFRDTPLVLVLDEAHQMLLPTSSDLSKECPLEAFNVIAKEGRKYGLTLCLATQRPGDIPDDVLSQVGTFIVHRLVSDSDRHAIERASGVISHAFSERLPLLGPGEAYMMGIEFVRPLKLKMLSPRRCPVSNGPNFQASWRLAHLQ